MRILWFSTNSACYKYEKQKICGYNGGGWMSSLQNELMKEEDISLGICFCTNGEPEKVIQEGVTYYPVSHHVKRMKDKVLDVIKINDAGRDEVLWPYYIEKFKKVIIDFKPDVIEVFGSELYVGLSAIAAKELNVVCCLHIQGVLSLCMETFLPPGVSRNSFYFSDGIKGAYANWQYLAYWKRSCHRERAILHAVPHLIGRTSWDYAVMRGLAPEAQYHYGGEILRPCFYEQGERKIPETTTIVTTSSGATYKGFDIVLKSAKYLKEYYRKDFIWKVFGNVSPFFFEKTTGINHEDVNVKLCGVALAERLREEMLNATVYVQPSYIENSPNSIAEAQMLGLPVVASDVGGTSSFVSHGHTGLLYPVNEPFIAAYNINMLSKDMEENRRIGRAGKEAAQKRHDRKNIIHNLSALYKELSEKRTIHQELCQQEKQGL